MRQYKKNTHGLSISMQKYRLPFSLLEIIICLSLLACIGSVATIKGYELLKQSRIAYSNKRFAEEMQLTRCIASSYKIDIEVHLVKKKNKVQFIRVADSPPEINYLFNTPINLPNFSLSETEVHLVCP